MLVIRHLLITVILSAAVSSAAWSYSPYISGTNSDNSSDSNLSTAMATAQSAIIAQNTRMKVISENIANAQVGATSSDKNPYRRKIIFFRNESQSSGERLLVVDRIVEDTASPFGLKYQPNNPAADASGYVKYPNVDTIIEMANQDIPRP